MTKPLTAHAPMASALLASLLLALPAWAVEVAFKPVTEGVYAYVGETEGRTYDNEGLNANLGLIITPAGAVLIDSGSSHQVAAKIHEAVKKVTSQPLKLVINSGDQD
ncbi:MAG: MBL fold metallo-hydrolase, partial [Rhodoferax sp.]|nr:MBL fold metallo-hydrolase [Rhodoferax sp.]